jgi:aminoglycoside phosphotransferase
VTVEEADTTFHVYAGDQPMTEVLCMSSKTIARFKHETRIPRRQQDTIDSNGLHDTPDTFLDEAPYGRNRELMKRLAHSYTNDTSSDGRVVVKVYQGPDAPARGAREAAVLRAAKGRLPVPELLSVEHRQSRFSFMPGVHGQDLIADGHGRAVLSALGSVLRTIHSVDPVGVFDDDPVPPGFVLVHGDFGPNNVLLAADASTVTAVLDWEWAHVGDPIIDLAWCEWIVRMHHPELVDDVGHFFAGYGGRPSWQRRHEAMVAQCRRLVDFWQRWRPETKTTEHRKRQLATTERWTQ